MHYLKCIALLEFLQKKLYAEQRQQVPVSVVSEVQRTLIGVQKLMEKETDPEVSNRIDDIMVSIIAVQNTPGLTSLTDSMKTTITSGVSELSEMLSLKAYRYFQVNDFEDTPEIIPVLRSVVKVALQKGVL